MPQYDGKEILTIGKADQARTAIQNWLLSRGADEVGRLYKPGHEGPFWSYSLEETGESAIGAVERGVITWPRGVYAEAVNDWCIGLYPTRDEGVDSEAAQLVRDWERAIAQGRSGEGHMAGVAMAQFLRDKHLS